MFDPSSRYYHLKTATFKRVDGETVSYVRRRFVPKGEDLPTLVEVTVTDGDRLDLIAARTIGNPEHFWRICDAENATDPTELTAESGRRVRVPIPQREV